MFVFDELEGLSVTTKPMFGCHAIYVGEKIVLILRDKESFPKDNGVWLATSHEHHASLKGDFPQMRSLELFGSEGATSWQNLAKDDPEFEENVVRACALVRKNDPRIGKVPKRRKPRAKKKKRA